LARYQIAVDDARRAHREAVEMKPASRINQPRGRASQ
jgi:hypothetical protein